MTNPCKCPSFCEPVYCNTFASHSSIFVQTVHVAAFFCITCILCNIIEILYETSLVLTSNSNLSVIQKNHCMNSTLVHIFLNHSHAVVTVMKYYLITHMCNRIRIWCEMNHSWHNTPTFLLYEGTTRWTIDAMGNLCIIWTFCNGNQPMSCVSVKPWRHSDILNRVPSFWTLRTLEV
jgi:hypothetical protein